MKKIEAKDVRFRYRRNGKEVLDGLSLSCEAGTITVLLGLNGSGKTTLIKCLAGILTPKDGEIFLDGQNLRKLSVKERAKRMAYVAQRSGSTEDFLVKDYLLFGKVNQFRFYESPKKEDERDAEQLAKEFDITKLLDKKLCEISGGERQIVSICSALLQQTDLIILDEPTSALDIKNQSLVLSALKRIAQKGKTIILSSHNPNHALCLDSEVALMRDGKVTEFGHASDIVKPEILKQIYGDRIRYSKELSYEEVSFDIDSEFAVE